MPFQLNCPQMMAEHWPICRVFSSRTPHFYRRRSVLFQIVREDEYRPYVSSPLSWNGKQALILVADVYRGFDALTGDSLELPLRMRDRLDKVSDTKLVSV